MFTIRNSADLTEIDIIGSIGEDWFSEGNTLETVRNQFIEIENDITVNISSLGGDLIEALAIHDMFKAHPQRVTTNIIGATASAGTVIALGGDTVKISENSLFLGHKASMMVAGNAEDLRAAADDLDKYDSRLVAIYKKKTGKTKSEIHDWLAQDKWLTAEEAKSFGLVDEIYKSKKVLNTIEELSQIHELPQNYIQMDNKTTVDKFLASIGLQTIKAQTEDDLVAENEALKSQLAELQSELELAKGAIEVEKTAVIEASKTAITEVQTDLDKVKAELETTKAELAKATAAAPTVTAGADPNPTGDPRKLSATEQVLANIFASVTEEEKLIYATKNN